MGIEDILIGGDDVIYGKTSFGQLLKFTGTLSSATGTIPAAWQSIEGGIRDERSAFGTDRQGGLWTITNITREIWREHAGSEKAFGRFIPINSSIAYWYFDSHSRLWLFDYQDLWLYDGQTWRLAQQPDIGFVRDMASDPAGRVWVAGDRGIAVYDPALESQP
jgi:ligand-binding sensor domain-containing protein